MSSRLHILRVVKPMLPKKQLIIIYHGLIQSIYDYCYPIYKNFTQKDVNRLMSMKRRAHNIICNSECHEDCLPCFKDRWKMLSQKLFNNIAANSTHILSNFLLARSVRSGRFLLPNISSNNLLNSFIIHNSILFNEHL